jgi:hypothetical protein
MSSLVSVTSICNQALAYIGLQPISGPDLTASGNSSRVCAIHYDRSRQTLLRQFPWAFAAKFSKVTFTKNASNGAMTATLPSDYIKMISTAFGDNTYQIIGREVYYRADTMGCGFSPILMGSAALGGVGNNIYYVYDLVDTALFDPLFVDCIALDLASRIARPLVGSLQEAQALRVQAREALATAMSIASQEESTEVFGNGPNIGYY